ncbi:translation initiation factor IF-2-like [Panthera leo]|uniref:translation initiation factor IF-2-like n=1 Tax=Panthera leo TaxID=9689 RepID=UPI001C6A8DB3|nr:translation initiation factor IF-2-like [Panthera leo]
MARGRAAAPASVPAQAPPLPPERGCAREGARGSRAPRRPPRPGIPDPEPASAKSAAGSRGRGRRSRAPPRAPRCRPAGCCGGNRSRRAAGGPAGDNGEEEAAGRVERSGSPAREAPGTAPAAGPRSERSSQIPCKEPPLVCQTYWGLSTQLPQTPAAGPPMAVGTSP